MALKGLKVIEMAGLAPAPFCGMILADFGAKVTRVDRTPGKGRNFINSLDTLARGKRSVSINLKSQEGVEVVRKLYMDADVLIEPFRKGVMEKLGLGPETLLQDNPKLVYARLTGFGQTGPLFYITAFKHKPWVMEKLGLGPETLLQDNPKLVYARLTGFGVMEKLGLGPETLLQDNPKLVYARLTGFGQTGPLSHKAGHDINYIATSGVLAQLGRHHEKPYPPVNLIADFAGGGLMCAVGIMMALHERHHSGQGQVIDANMVNGSAYVSTFLWTSRAMPIWPGERGENTLDGGTGFYDTYETKDGKYMSVGALEPQFYADLLKGLGLTKEEMPQSTDSKIMSDRFTQIFKSKTRDEWTEIFKDLDACVFPVLEKEEASSHPFNVDNEIFLQNSDGNVEPAPAPKLSRTGPVTELLPLPNVGQHTIEELRKVGFSQDIIDKLIENQIVFQNSETTSKL